MRRGWSGAMPVTLTLPLSLARKPRVRQRRRRRLAFGALIALAVALLAVGFWLPARAERAQQQPHRGAWLATLALGDELTLARPDGAVYVYAVTDLDVVDGAHAELAFGSDESVAVLVTGWPFEAADVGGTWRYVVTARRRF